MEYYHNHEIFKVKMNLGEEQERKNYIYEIYKEGKYINTAFTLQSAKNYIDSGYNDNYL